MHVPAYRKQHGRDFAFVEHQGKRHRLPGVYNSPESRDAYATFISRIVAARQSPSPTAPTVTDGLTVEAMVAAFLDHAAAYYGVESTWHGEYANFRYALRLFLDEYRPLAAADIGPLRLKALQDKLAESGRSRSYINSCLAKIKRCYKWAVSRELVPVSVYQALLTVPSLAAGRTKARESAKRAPIPWEHAELVLAELSPVTAAMVQIQWLTGVRSGSLVRARAEQFDRSRNPWLWRPPHKNQFRGKVLVVPIGPKCQAILEPFMSRKGFLFDPRETRPNRRYRDRYTSASYYRAIQRALKRVNAKRHDAAVEAGIDPKAVDKIRWFPHILRHSKGHSTRSQYGLEAAQAVLGHDSINTTELYSDKRLLLAIEVAKETG